ncbi:MAG TPA: alpha/beta fold hydrolase [Myxococcales bacterium]|nr:alpha/beta fold hydrolase [Myxococcales bacterium]
MPRTERGIHYQTLGDPAKPPLLLIMGLALSSRAWDRLPEHLARDFHVLVFDNLGTGRSPRRGVAYRMRHLAHDALAVLDAAGVRQAHVFGISMGGMIAQELAIRHPERVRSLALGCTFASWRKATAPPLRTKIDLALLNLGRVTPRRIARILVSAEWHAAHPDSALEWLRRAERTALRYATAQVLAIARHHTLDRLHRIRAPTLVLTGDADRLVPPANSEVLARSIPRARLRVLRGAGHVFPLEREEETVHALREHFLAS